MFWDFTYSVFLFQKGFRIIRNLKSNFVNEV
jgi:hypothetical protein